MRFAVTWALTSPVAVWAGVPESDCYPLATAIEALVDDGTLQQPVFVEEWSTCAGDGIGGPSAVVLPPGDYPDTHSALVAVVEANNSDGGLDYDVRWIEAGWSVAPSDRPRCAETPIGPIETVMSLDEFESHVLMQFASHCRLATAGRSMTSESMTRVEATTTTETRLAGPLLATTLGVLTDSGDPIGWSQRIGPDHQGRGAFNHGWRLLAVREPPVPDPFAEVEPLPPGVKGRLTDPDGRVRDVLEDGTIVEVRGPDPDRKETVEPSP
jgi:hypothetical protein